MNGAVSPQDVGASIGVLRGPSFQFVVANTLSVRQSPSTRAKKLATLVTGDFIPNLTWVPADEGSDLVWGYSAVGADDEGEGGYVLWAQKDRGNWKRYVVAADPLDPRKIGEKGVLGRKVERRVLASKLEIFRNLGPKAKPSKTLTVGDVIPDARWIGYIKELTPPDEQAAQPVWGYSAKLGGFFCWTKKDKAGKWQFAVGEGRPVFVPLALRGKAPAQSGGGGGGFEPGFGAGNKGTRPSNLEVPKPEADDEEGMDTSTMLAIGAAVLAGGFFLLRRK
jgi:hypothetical protein